LGWWWLDTWCEAEVEKEKVRKEKEEEDGVVRWELSATTVDGRRACGGSGGEVGKTGCGDGGKGDGGGGERRHRRAPCNGGWAAEREPEDKEIRYRQRCPFTWGEDGKEEIKSQNPVNSHGVRWKRRNKTPKSSKRVENPISNKFICIGLYFEMLRA
jgi:hypothetical protein